MQRQVLVIDLALSLQSPFSKASRVWVAKNHVMGDGSPSLEKLYHPDICEAFKEHDSSIEIYSDVFNLLLEVVIVFWYSNFEVFEALRHKMCNANCVLAYTLKLCTQVSCFFGSLYIFWHICEILSFVFQV